MVWRVLGFGGRPNPLLFARAASLAMRSAQCLGQSLCRKPDDFKSQLYVDDPAITVAGSPEVVMGALDVVLLWWLVLGLPLAWKKGALYKDSDTHIWIGVNYQVVDKTVIMAVP